MRAVACTLLGLLAFCTTASAQTQKAWCEQNCVTLCKKIYGARNAGPCITKYQCPQYAGRPCASTSYVQARYVVYCGNNPQECVHGSTR
jgi:hypothetical protein